MIRARTSALASIATLLLACGSRTTGTDAASDTAPDTACAPLASDRANCGACGHACASNETCNEGHCAPAKLDVLFVMDGVGGMQTAHNRLLGQLGGFLRTLSEGANGAIPVASLHVGAVSADLGTPGSSVPGCANSDLGDDGLLNPIRYGMAMARHEPWTYLPPTYLRPTDCVDPNAFPSFVAFDSSSGDLAHFEHDVLCNVAVGVDAICGLESQLEAIFRALVIHDARDTPGNTSPNAGFVRADATLAIILLTDEEDGSVRDCRFAHDTPCDGEGAIDVYRPASTAWSNMELNLRFYMYQPCGDQDPTWPLDRYVDPTDVTRGLYGLKPGRPDRIVFAAIAGMPIGTAPGPSGTIDWDALLGTPSSLGPDDFCGRDSSGLGAMTSAEGPISMQQANADPICSQRVVPACRAEGSPVSPTACTGDVQPFAWPSRRIIEIARRFDQAPLCDGHACHNGTVASVCASDYTSAMSRITHLIQSRL